MRSAVYNSQHLPTQVIDAAGQVTTITYNSFGEVATVTDPKSETTTYTYDTNGYLQKVTDALAGTQASYTYDSFGRVDTYTDVNGFATTYSYDDLNRITQIKYSDHTSDTYKYQGDNQPGGGQPGGGGDTTGGGDPIVDIDPENNLPIYKSPDGTLYENGPNGPIIVTPIATPNPEDSGF